MAPKLLKAKYEGKLPIGENNETILNVAVLEDGTRIITASAVFKAFGRIQRSNTRLINMPAFIDAQNLQTFVGEDLMALINQIEYETKDGKIDSGFNAIILPKLCKVYLDARAKNVLTKKQEPLARASEILLIGLSHIGIIALIDEATGYQYEREKDELQKILKAYISAELLPWEKRFPDEFYREIFRLNGWDYTVSGIKQRPGVIGTWTKKYIYAALPPGVLQALINETPRDENGKLKKRMHQKLTREQGIDHLNKQLISVVTLMNISDTWDDFDRLWNKKFGQQEIAFKEYDLLAPKGQKQEQPKDLSDFNKKLLTALNYNPKKKEQQQEPDAEQTSLFE